MQLVFHTHTLALKHQFNIARDSYSSQQVVIVELHEGDLSGLGEAITNAYYQVTVENMYLTLERLRPLIEGYVFDTPEAFWAFLAPHLHDNPFVLCALDNAANDLWAKKQGLPLYAAWGLKKENLPLTDYTIGIDSIEKMIFKMQEMPFPLYKIKLGTPNDIEIIETLRRHTTALFRVDANCGWTVEETIFNAKALKALGVEFIEQPLKADNWEGMREVFEKSVLPIIADESCQNEADVVKCVQHFHGINIKLVKCGGVTPARRMIAEARQCNLQVMMGCMTESSVGISAIAHLLPLLDYVDMDGPLLIKNDIAEGLTIDYGKVTFGEGIGLGVRLKNREKS